MKKLDLTKEDKYLYQPRAGKVELVDVPPMLFVMVDGVIPPEEMPGDSADFQEAVAALYGISYTLKFMVKQRAEDPIDYKVMLLEGLWAAESGPYDAAVRQPWLYTAMIRQPDFITPELFEEARARLLKKKPGPGPARARLETFHEGPSIQAMHLGPYATEPETVARLIAFGDENSYAAHGRHHEIYINDPFKTAPERLKTVLRHPVRVDSAV